MADVFHIDWSISQMIAEYIMMLRSVMKERHKIAAVISFSTNWNVLLPTQCQSFNISFGSSFTHLESAFFLCDIISGLQFNYCQLLLAWKGGN